MFIVFKNVMCAIVYKKFIFKMMSDNVLPNYTSSAPKKRTVNVFFQFVWYVEIAILPRRFH